MGIIVNLAGRRFGRLMVLRQVGRTGGGSVLWGCVCDCGNLCDVASPNLKTGHTQSCGCYKIERTKQTNSTHRKTKTIEYRLWSDMIMRCLDQGNKRYGGRGIRVCPRWREGDGVSSGFECFLSDLGPRPGGVVGRRAFYSIDRIDNDGDYEPGNTRWATRDQQHYNKNNTLFVELNGSRLTLREAVIAAGDVVSVDLAAGRMRDGWSGERAVTTPPFNRGQWRKKG